MARKCRTVAQQCTLFLRKTDVLGFAIMAMTLGHLWYQSTRYMLNAVCGWKCTNSICKQEMIWIITLIIKNKKFMMDEERQMREKSLLLECQSSYTAL